MGSARACFVAPLASAAVEAVRANLRNLPYPAPEKFITLIKFINFTCSLLAPRNPVRPRPASELRQVGADRGIGQKALYAARELEGIMMPKERTAHGRWLWMLPPAAEDDGEREREVGTLPGA